METFSDIDRVDVGRVKGAYGVKGFLRVESLSAVPERFAIGSKIFLGNSESIVENFFWQNNSLILKLDCINDRDDALSFKGTVLKIGIDQVCLLYTSPSPRDS